jgi:hypothetical protein
MHCYKIELEIAQDSSDLLDIRSVQIGNHGRVIIIKTNHVLMPGTGFSRN